MAEKGARFGPQPPTDEELGQKEKAWVDGVVESIGRPQFERDGWCRQFPPPNGGDARKLVTLEQDGMTWVGIRAYSHANSCWMNNNLASVERVIAWRDVPAPAHD